MLGCDGEVNTSFLRRCEVVKENRLRPRGFDPKWFAQNPSEFVRELAKEGPKEDPDYTDPSQTGKDALTYAVAIPQGTPRPVSVSARLYSQSIPPPYLYDRFADASYGESPKKRDIQRLYYLTSHLNTGAKALDGRPYIESYKLLVAAGSATEAAP